MTPKQVKPFSILSLICALLLAACDQLPDFSRQPHMAYHFDAPATEWPECLPLGNGRIGLTPDGGIDRETIILNESSMWSGSRQEADNPDAAHAFGRARELILEGRAAEAEALMNEAFVCRGVGTNRGDAADKPFGSYQLLGRLTLGYAYDGSERTSATGYRRELSLDDAVATVTFRRGKATYTREAFTSFASDVAVVRLTADRERTLGLRIGLDRPERYAVSTDGRELEMHGRLYVGDGQLAPPTRTPNDTGVVVEDSVTRAARLEGGGVRYAARVRVVLPRGGQLRAANDSTLAVEGAPEIILLVAMATDFFGQSPDAAVRKQLEAAASRPYETLRREHVAAYRERYERVHLRLGRPGLRDSWPINRRLDAFSRGRRDPSLVALYYQFGRYLLISSTRPGALPPASQGLWCATTHTPDNGAYRLDGPLQMSYWAAETGNLPEAIAPLVEWTRRLSANGRNTAAAYYGARGWTAHTWANVWDFTAPDRQPVWSASPTAAARLCASLYEHFRFTRDTAYLRSVYPLLRDAALCLSDRLSEDPRSRRLVIAPSLSPENVYLSPNGRRDTFGVGSTVDQSLVRELFTNTLHAASILRTDIELSGLLSAYIARLTPIPLTRDGRIAEWPEPLREAESRTVFVPQLYGLFPSTEISLSRTPELAEAARRTLEARDEGATGLPLAARISLWAHLGDGDHAYRLLRDLLRPVAANDTQSGGTYPNLFFAAPTFLLAGNLGATAGIAEMLVQSDDDGIRFLPARPAAWSDGEFRGLRVRGGGEVWARWRGREVHAGLRAVRAGVFRIKLPATAADLSVRLGGHSVSCPVIAGAIVFPLSPGDELEVSWREK